jgi:hypothetical protein
MAAGPRELPVLLGYAFLARMLHVLLRPFKRSVRQFPLVALARFGRPLLLAATDIFVGEPRFLNIEFLFSSYKQ